MAGREGGAPAGEDLRVPRDPQQREQHEVDPHRHLGVAGRAELLILRPDGGGRALGVIERPHAAQVHEAEQGPAEQQEEQRHCRQR